MPDASKVAHFTSEQKNLPHPHPGLAGTFPLEREKFFLADRHGNGGSAESPSKTDTGTCPIARFAEARALILRFYRSIDFLAGSSAGYVFKGGHDLKT